MQSTKWLGCAQWIRDLSTVQNFRIPHLLNSRAFWSGIALIVGGGIPTVQQFREYLFTSNGMKAVSEHSFVSLPIRFGNHTITIADSLPQLDHTSHTQVEATVTIQIDGRALLPPTLAMVRPGGVEFGRYHGWINTQRFTDMATGRSCMLVATRPSGPPRGLTEFAMARIDERGTISTFTANEFSRRQSYPVSRVTDILNWDGAPLFPWSDWPWPIVVDFFPINLLQALAPFAAMLLGSALVARALIRGRSFNRAKT